MRLNDLETMGVAVNDESGAGDSGRGDQDDVDGQLRLMRNPEEHNGSQTLKTEMMRTLKHCGDNFGNCRHSGDGSFEYAGDSKGG